MPDNRPERERYAHASLREQVASELRGLSRTPALIALLLAVGGGWLLLNITKPAPAPVDRLAVGDCLYIHAGDAEPDASLGRPIGTDDGALIALYAGGAEHAPCNASHSHEVADAWVLEGSTAAPYPGQVELTTAHTDRCSAAFEAYVGHPVEGSELTFTVAIPPPRAWEKGTRAAACLVSRANGGYLPAPARGSNR